MSKFAKVFDIPQADTQVLVHLTTDSTQGYPQVRIITEMDGVEVCAAPGYGPKDASQPWDEDLAWKKATEFFNSIDQDRAEQLHAGITSLSKRS